MKQNLQDDTYNFNFRYESIYIGVSSLRRAVDELPEVIACAEENENGDGLMCSICHEMFSAGETAKQLPCKHLYHSMCIRLWVRRKNSCPMCRDEPVLVLPSLNGVA